MRGTGFFFHYKLLAFFPGRTPLTLFEFNLPTDSFGLKTVIWPKDKVKNGERCQQVPCVRHVTLQGFCVAGKPQKHCISAGSAKEMLLATKADAIKSDRKILIFKGYFALANTNVCSFGFSQRYFSSFYRERYLESPKPGQRQQLTFSSTLLSFISTAFSIPSQHLLPSILWANIWSLVAEEIWSLYQGWFRCINPSIQCQSATEKLLRTVNSIFPLSAQFESLAFKE